MKVVSSVDGSQLIELKLEGTLKLNPLQAREFLEALAVSGLSDNAVMRVGRSESWVKLCSRWGSAARFTVVDRIEIAQLERKER